MDVEVEWSRVASIFRGLQYLLLAFYVARHPALISGTRTYVPLRGTPPAVRTVDDYFARELSRLGRAIKMFRFI